MLTSKWNNVLKLKKSILNNLILKKIRVEVLFPIAILLR